MIRPLDAGFYSVEVCAGKEGFCAISRVVLQFEARVGSRALGS